MRQVLASVAAISLAAAKLALAAQEPASLPATPRASAFVDLTGQWVSVVTEDWAWRIVTAPRGDYSSIPLNAEGIRVSETWDPQADSARGDACKAFGAAGIMRLPGRLRISWVDDSTLRIEADAGTQTRFLHFGAAAGLQEEPSLQGHSVASWSPAQDSSRGLSAPVLRPGQGGALTVVTSRMQPGYLRKNGIPYSASATMTEYFDRWRLPDGQEWMTVTSVVVDPAYLNEPFITSTDFKRETDRSRWHPTGCVTPSPFLDKPARPDR